MSFKFLSKPKRTNDRYYPRENSLRVSPERTKHSHSHSHSHSRSSPSSSPSSSAPLAVREPAKCKCMYTCNKMRAFLRYADGAHLIEHLYAVEEKDVTSLSLTPEEHAHEGLFCALYKCRARIHFLDLAFGVHPQHFRFSFIQTLCVLVTRPILPRVVIVRNVSGGVLDIDEEMAHNIASVIGTYARRCESISTKPASGEIVIQLHDMSMSENAQHILTDELMHQHDSGRFVANVGIYRTVKTSVVPELLQRLFVNGPAQGDA